MKTRTPISIYIATTIGLTIMAFEMFASDSGYFSSPFFWALILIATILLLIMNSIGDLVENQSFSKLSEEEKKQYLEEKKFRIIRNYGIQPSKNKLLRKKRIFLSTMVLMELQSLTTLFRNGGSACSGSDVFSVPCICLLFLSQTMLIRKQSTPKKQKRC